MKTCAAASPPTTACASPRLIPRASTARCCCRFPACSFWQCARLRRLFGAHALRLHPHLGRDRAGVADILVVMDFVAAREMVEVAGEHGVAVEVEQAALLGDEKAEILLGRDLGDLAERLIAEIVVAILLDAVAALLLDVDELPRGDAERLVDRLVQVGVPIFPQ